MDIKALETKIKFLDAAAFHYSMIAPATSAHLMLQRNFEAANNSVPVQRSGACRACGTTLISGSTSRTSIVHEPSTTTEVHSRKHGNDDSARKPIKFLRVDCLICRRYERKPLQGPSRPNVKKLSALKPGTLPSVGGFAAKEPLDMPQSARVGTASASSKQRAKARKHGGLQAMLEKTKVSANSSSGFGLDLLDLMKQS